MADPTIDEDTLGQMLMDSGNAAVQQPVAQPTEVPASEPQLPFAPLGGRQYGKELSLGEAIAATGARRGRQIAAPDMGTTLPPIQPWSTVEESADYLNASAQKQREMQKQWTTKALEIGPLLFKKKKELDEFNSQLTGALPKIEIPKRTWAEAAEDMYHSFKGGAAQTAGMAATLINPRDITYEGDPENHLLNPQAMEDVSTAQRNSASRALQNDRKLVQEAIDKTKKEGGGELAQFWTEFSQSLKNPRVAAAFITEQVPTIATLLAGGELVGAVGAPMVGLSRASIAIADIAGNLARVRAVSAGASAEIGEAAAAAARTASLNGSRQVLAGDIGRYGFSVPAGSVLGAGDARQTFVQNMESRPDKEWAKLPEYQKRVTAGEDSDAVKRDIATRESWAATALGGAMGAAAGKFGIEELIGGGAKGGVKARAGRFVGEVLPEFGEEIPPQVLSNLEIQQQMNPELPTMAGTGSIAAQTLISSGAMGGVAALGGGHGRAAEEPSPPPAPGTEPPAPTGEPGVPVTPPMPPQETFGDRARKEIAEFGAAIERTRNDPSIGEGAKETLIKTQQDALDGWIKAANEFENTPAVVDLRNDLERNQRKQAEIEGRTTLDEATKAQLLGPLSREQERMESLLNMNEATESDLEAIVEDRRQALADFDQARGLGRADAATTKRLTDELNFANRVLDQRALVETPTERAFAARERTVFEKDTSGNYIYPTRNELASQPMQAAFDQINDIAQSRIHDARTNRIYTRAERSSLISSARQFEGAIQRANTILNSAEEGEVQRLAADLRQGLTNLLRQGQPIGKGRLNELAAVHAREGLAQGEQITYGEALQRAERELSDLVREHDDSGGPTTPPPSAPPAPPVGPPVTPPKAPPGKKFDPGGYNFNSGWIAHGGARNVKDAAEGKKYVDLLNRMTALASGWRKGVVQALGIRFVVGTRSGSGWYSGSANSIQSVGQIAIDIHDSAMDALHIAAHEVSHALDDVMRKAGKFISQAQDAFATNGVLRNEIEGWDKKYLRDKSLSTGYPLSFWYPLRYSPLQGNERVQRSELFAQVLAYYHSNPQDLAKYLPRSYAFAKEIFDGLAERDSAGQLTNGDLAGVVLAAFSRVGGASAIEPGRNEGRIGEAVAQPTGAGNLNERAGSGVAAGAPAGSALRGDVLAQHVQEVGDEVRRLARGLGPGNQESRGRDIVQAGIDEVQRRIDEATGAPVNQEPATVGPTQGITGRAREIAAAASRAGAAGVRPLGPAPLATAAQRAPALGGTNAGETNLRGQREQAQEGNRQPVVPLFSGGEQPIQGFYSALVRGVEALSASDLQGLKQDKVKASDWSAAIKRITVRGVKAEIESTGVSDWLATFPKDEPVKKSMVLKFLRDADAGLTEVMLSKNSVQEAEDVLSALGYTYSTTMGTLFDGPNEVNLDEEPEELRDILKAAITVLETDDYSHFPGALGIEDVRHAGLVEPDGENYKELLLKVPGSGFSEQYHYPDHPNVIAHVRFNTRVGPSGERVLFLEEIQSDWAQQGRERGFHKKGANTKQASAEEQISAREEEQKRGYAYRAIESLNNFGFGSAEEVAGDMAGYFHEGITAGHTTRQSIKDTLDKYDFGGSVTSRETVADWLSSLPDANAELAGMDRLPEMPLAPFVTSTDAWTGLVLKRMLHYAAENGFDRIAWTNGDQQVRRYKQRLVQSVDKVEITKHENGTYGVRATQGMNLNKRVVFNNPSMTAMDVRNLLGKSASKQVLSKADGAPGKAHVINSKNLEVGGEGMRSYYDQIVPKVANDVAKRTGAEPVATIDLKFGEKSQAVESIRVNEESRQAALAGQPLFSRGGGTGTTTKAEITSHINRLFGVTKGDLTKALKNVRVISEADLPEGKYERASGARIDIGNTVAFYDPHTNEVVLIADRIPKGLEIPVIMHELFHKRGGQLLGDKQIKRFRDEVKSWQFEPDGSLKNELWQQAHRRVNRELGRRIEANQSRAGIYDEELLPYVIQGAFERGIKIDPKLSMQNSVAGMLARWYNAVRDALAKAFGVAPKSISVDDVLAAAYGAAQLELPGVGVERAGRVLASSRAFAERRAENRRSAFQYNPDVAAAGQRGRNVRPSAGVFAAAAPGPANPKFSNAVHFASHQAQPVKTVDQARQRATSGDMPTASWLPTARDRFLTNWQDHQRPFYQWLKEHGLSLDAWKALKLVPAAMRTRSEGYVKEVMDPINKSVAAFAKKHKIPVAQAAEDIGQWTTLRHIPEANVALRDKLRKRVVANENGAAAALKAFDDTQAGKHPTGDEARAPMAGGYTTAEAKEIQQLIERRIPASEIEPIANEIVAGFAKMKAEALKSGQISAEAVKNFPKFDHYVALTGTPWDDTASDSFGSYISGNLLAQREGGLHVADPALMALGDRVSRVASYASSVDFKKTLNDLYESSGAQKNTIGLLRMNATDKSDKTHSDVVWNAPDGERYIFRFANTDVGEAMLSKNREYQDNLALRMMDKATRLFSRAVTQYTMGFALANTFRDIQEKAVLIRSRGVVDAAGNVVAPNDLFKRSWARYISLDTLRAAQQLAFKGRADPSTPAGRYANDLADLGGISTFGQQLKRGRESIEKEIKRHVGLRKQLSSVNKFVEDYNLMMELLSSLSVNAAMRDLGVDAKESAFQTLDLMNFQNQGAKTAWIKGMYSFFNPAVQSGVNLFRQISTKRGAMDALALGALAWSLYALSKATADDDEELGNEIDQRGTFEAERNMTVKLGDTFFKIPIGFGLPQLMWASAVNAERYRSGRYSGSDALGQQVTQFYKTFSPVPPSEVTVTQQPANWFVKTMMPTIFKPAIDLATDTNAWGQKLTAYYPDKNKFAAEQGRAQTPQFYKELADHARRESGIDYYPEQWRALVDGMAWGPLGYALRAWVDTNKENEGRKLNALDEMPGAGLLKTLGTSRFIGGQSQFMEARYYDQYNKASVALKAYNAAKEDGTGAQFLAANADRRQLIDALKSQEMVMRGLTKEYNSTIKELQSGHGSPDLSREKLSRIQDQKEQAMRAFLKSVKAADADAFDTTDEEE